MARESIELSSASVNVNVNANANTIDTTTQHNPFESDGSTTDPRPPNTEFSLPPADTGKQAWLFLAACWIVESLVFGFGFSFGVFQDFYSSHQPFAGSGNVAVIGTTTLGTMYIGTPFVLALCRLFPRYARWFTPAGLLTAALAILFSSFCTTVPQLIGTQGFLFGLGGCFAFAPTVLYIDEWFARRKGMAYGIVWSAAGFGGVVFPLILEALLNNLGFQSTARIWAGMLFVFAAPVALFIKPRLPYSATIHRRPFNMRFLLSRSFIMHQIANFIQASGYFLPGIYLPIYARMTFGASTLSSALTVILLNIFASIGAFVMGSLTDRLSVTTCVAISALGGSTSVLLIWGFSASIAPLYIFCIFYGLFAGCWTSTWPGVMKEVAQSVENEGHGYVDPVMVFGQLSLGRGIGNIVSGLISAALVTGMPWKGDAIAGYGSGYGTLIVFTGLTGFLSGMNFLGRRLHLL